MKASSLLFRQGSISSILTILLLILSLVFVNWQIQILGMEKYGLLVLLLSVFGTINLLNIGIGTAMVSYYTKFGEDKSVFWSLFISSFMLLSIFSIVVFAPTLFFHNVIFEFLNVDNQNLDIFAFIGFVLIGISRLLSSIISSYWMSTIEFMKLKLFGFASIYFSITMILVLTLFGYSFNDTLYYSGLANILGIYFLFIRIIITHTDIKVLQIFYNTRINLKEFLLSGFAFQGIAIINNLSNPVVNTLINSHFGLTAVSLFDIVLKLLRSGRQILVSSTEPMFGKMTHLNNLKKNRLIHLLTLKYTKIMLWFSLAYCIVTLFLSKLILIIWMGEEIAQSTYILVNIISLGFAINIATSVIYNQYLAVKETRIYIFIHQLMLLFFPIIPFFFNILTLHDFAIAFSISFALSSLYLFGIFLKPKKERL